jgi:stearoyl-CoA 9-desaturase NADPH oxidoreductase
MPHVRVVLVDSQTEGFFSEQHLDVYCADYAQRDVYICGPAAMIQHSRQLLADLHVSATQIHFEFFGPAPLEMTGAAEAGITEFRRSTLQVANPEQKQTLLDMAERAGLKPASGCRMGVCYQCICKKESGVVFNTKTGQYSDTGKQDVQMCISIPVGDVVLDI